jgi:hypothetical protein
MSLLHIVNHDLPGMVMVAGLLAAGILRLVKG